MAGDDGRIGRKAAAFLILALAHAAAGGAVASEVLGLRLGRHDAFTRLVIDTTAPVTAVPEFESANRLTVAIRTNDREPVRKAAGLTPEKSLDLIARARWDDTADSRVLVDLAGPGTIKRQFRLPRSDDQPYRLVVDLAAADTGPDTGPDTGSDVGPDSGPDAGARAEAAGKLVSGSGPGKRLPERIEPSIALTETVFAREQPPEIPPALSQEDGAATAGGGPAGSGTAGSGTAGNGPTWHDRVDSVRTAAAGTVTVGNAATAQGPVDEYEDYLDDPPGGDGVSVSAYLEGEVRGFVQKSEPPGLTRWSTSLAFSPEIEAAFSGGDHSLSIQPFVRLDSEDDKRTHVDLREAKWVGLFGPVEARVGVDVVFWGVTESIHLVDVINQDDLLEDIDNEDKLGQPMASLSWNTGAGVLTGFVLPYFRERRFPGADGRPGTPIVVDPGRAVFESGEDDWHVDYAIRYSNAVGPFDFGLYYFAGTARDPQLIPQTTPTGDPVLIPRYDVVDQVGFDGQATLGSLLVKFEGIHQWDNSTGHFTAAAGGFEYTLFDVDNSGGDVGILFEYLHDGRGETLESPFEDDVFVALRYGSGGGGTRLLAGGIIDTGDGATAINVEASRRLGDSWRVSLDARLFLDVPATNALAPFRDDDFLQLRLTKFF